MELKALSRLGWSVTALAREYGAESPATKQPVAFSYRLTN